nr:MAG TPA: hypothetical protein [Caudoviricetes sp.]
MERSSLMMPSLTVVSAYKLLTVEGLLVLVFLQDNGAKFLDDAFLDEQFGLVLLFKFGYVGLVDDEHGALASYKPFCRDFGEEVEDILDKLQFRRLCAI